MGVCVVFSSGHPVKVVYGNWRSFSQVLDFPEQEDNNDTENPEYDRETLQRSFRGMSLRRKLLWSVSLSYSGFSVSLLSSCSGKHSKEVFVVCLLGDAMQSLPEVWDKGIEVDRKSTRLNSSHSQISYAVFCLKK